MFLRNIARFSTQTAKNYANFVAKPLVSPLKSLSVAFLGFAGGYAYAQQKSNHAVIQASMRTVVPQNIHKALQLSPARVEEILSQEEKNYDNMRKELSSMKIFLTKEQIKSAVQTMADQIAKQFQGEKHLLVLTLLQGASYFANDLKIALHQRDLLFKEGAMRIGRYGDGHSGSVPKAEYMPTPEQVIGRRILIIEELIEEGVTLDWTIKKLIELGAEPKDIYIAVFTDKVNARKTGYEHIKPHFSGFIMEKNLWVCGYGSDHLNLFRAAENLFVLPEVAQKPQKQSGCR